MGSQFGLSHGLSAAWPSSADEGPDALSVQEYFETPSNHARGSILEAGHAEERVLVPFQPLLGNISNAPKLLRPYSQVEHCQSRHGAASPVHLRCRILSPGSPNGKKGDAETIPKQEFATLLIQSSFETLFHGLIKRENPDGPSPVLDHSKDYSGFSL